jgi:hypothetical protein
MPAVRTSLSWLDTNPLPGVGNSLLLVAIRPIAMSGIDHSAPSEGGEVGRGREAPISNCIVPILSRFFPGIAANRRCAQKQATGAPAARKSRKASQAITLLTAVGATSNGSDTGYFRKSAAVR